MRRSALAALIAALLLTGCNTILIDGIHQARSDAGRTAVERVAYLNEAAHQKSVEMCGRGAAIASPDPAARYRGETAAAVAELVASEPLDRSIESAASRNAEAAQRLWARFRTNPTITDARWDAVGIGEHVCGNGRLYATIVLRDGPSMPASGRYSSLIHAVSDITVVEGVKYGSAVTHTGQTVDLLLDLHLPPDAGLGPRPAIIAVHGGGFTQGSRANMTGTARDYARRGFVAATISYRLRSSMTTLPQLLAAAEDGIDDGATSVQWLRANAATYDVDVSRIAMVGSSAGGGIALGVAAGDQGGLAAAVSTGLHLTPGLDRFTFEPTDAPVMMFHYEQDTAAPLRSTWQEAFETCQAFRTGGTTCDFVRQPGSGHTVSLAGNSAWWTPQIGPFLWQHLRLASLPR